MTMDLVKLLDHPTAIVGITGSGKTFAAKGVVEHLIREGRRVIIIDPTGAYWGLRAGATPGSDGLPVMIFGGEHADLPIVPEAAAGRALGAALAERDVQAIIDTSEMTGGEKVRFLTPFLEALYAKNKAALHIIIDEADEIAAQRIADGEQRLFGIFDKIVRRGRIKGFRPLMITQRPAVIHKNVLSQVGTLIALKLTSPQDRKAIDDWVKGNADAGQAREVMSSLPTLARGEGWVWSPADDVLVRTTFPPITTFDSSKTPEIGAVITAPAMTPIDVENLRDAMAAAAAPVEDTQPARGGVSAPSPDQLAAAEHRARERGYADGYRDAKAEWYRKGIRSQIMRVAEALAGAAMIVGHQDAFSAAHGKIKSIEDDVPPEAPPGVLSLEQSRAVLAAAPITLPKSNTGTAPVDASISPSARKIVAAVRSVYPRGISLAAAAKRAGLSSKSSAYRKYLEQAAASRELVLRDGGRYASVRPPNGESPPVGLEAYKERLPGSYRRMLEAIEAGAGRALSKDEIAARAGVSRTSSGLGAGIKELVSLGLIVVEHSDGFSLSPDFLPGAIG